MIGIIGYGVIGKVTHEALFPSTDVLIHDITMDSKISNLFGCDIVFICTPTNNESDILTIKGIIGLFSKNSPETEMVVRSTITPGFFDGCVGNVSYLPEFLRERMALSDAKKSKNMLYATNTERSKLNNYDFSSKLIEVSFSELEIVKLMSNNYYSMKVVFANHFYDLCQRHGVNYDDLLNTFEMCKNGQSYMDVNESLRGYGGKCLPKDIDFAISIFDGADLFKAIQNDNAKWPTTIRKDT